MANVRGSAVIAFICAALTRTAGPLALPPPSLELCRPLASPSFPPCLLASTRVAFHNPQPSFSLPASLYNSIHLPHPFINPILSQSCYQGLRLLQRNDDSTHLIRKICPGHSIFWLVWQFDEEYITFKSSTRNILPSNLQRQ